MLTPFNHPGMFALAAVVGVAAAANASPPPAPCGDAPVRCAPPPLAHNRTIDIALCLDTSGSMSGLIDAARRTMWDIVNECAAADPTPTVRVALLTYGNNSHDASHGWVRIDSPLTTNLDHISQKLFALTTNGGTEYVGRVVDCAARSLCWSSDPGAMRLLVVAGNESADQDQQVRYLDACATARKKDIIINSIYCGQDKDAIAPGWRAVATLGEGQFASINHNQTVPQIDTPYDKVLIELSAELNATYIPYGKAGAAAQQNQQFQDGNAESLSAASAASRAATKGSSVYVNAHWDLVDAATRDGVDITSVPEADLPEAMQTMSASERTHHVEQMITRRTQIQQQIKDQQTHRLAYIAEARAAVTATPDTFDQAILEAIRSQAAAAGFTFTGRPADNR